MSRPFLKVSFVEIVSVIGLRKKLDLSKFWCPISCHVSEMTDRNAYLSVG